TPPLTRSASNSGASSGRMVSPAMGSVFQITAVASSTFLTRWAAALRSRTAAKRRLADAPDHTIQACHLSTLLRSDLAQAVDDAALRRHRVLREARPGLSRQFANIYVALAIDGDAVRRSELPRQDAAWCLAKPRQDLALQRMDADARPYFRPVAVALALRPALADVAEQVMPAPQAHAVWTVEVIPLCLPFAVRVEHLHAVVLAVGDVNPALRIAADVVRNVELAGIGARLAP